MNYFIECEVRFYGDRKINAIKTWRAATSCGLKESNDLVEAAERGWTKVRMTVEAYGFLRATSYPTEASDWESFDLTEVKLLRKEEPVPFDFTRPAF